MAETEIVEASVDNFKKEISEKDARLKEAETKFLKRLVQEAKDAGVTYTEQDLLEIGEKGILKLIEQAKSFKKSLKEDSPKVEVKETKGQTMTETKEYCPRYAVGPIKTQGHEMWREWNYASFKQSYVEMLCGKPQPEDFY
jgi:methionine synthase II (cobalamin-independent)